MDFSQLLKHRHRRWNVFTCFISLFLFIISSYYLMVGEILITPFDELTQLHQQLVLQLRLPRLLAAIAVGASLALSGAVLQVLLGNVLAEPGVLGISGGASVMMVLLLFFLPMFATPIGYMVAAVIGALLFTLLLVTLAKAMHLTTTRLLLVGVALGILSGAVVTWAFYFSDDLNLRQLLYWLMGNVGGASWYHHILTLVLIPIVAWLCVKGRLLDKLMLGEQHAKQLGVDVDAVRWQLILAVSVLVGGAVALGGVIGFVGLVVPHLLRLAFGSENRFLLPLSALTGASLVVTADLVARTALDAAELPLGVVTTSVGAPIFIWMLVKNHDVR